MPRRTGLVRLLFLLQYSPFLPMQGASVLQSSAPSPPPKDGANPGGLLNDPGSSQPTKYEDSQNPEQKAKNQFECGPLLRYDTIENGEWHGAALIVTASAQSTDKPTLKYSWDPERPLSLHRQHIREDGDSADLGLRFANLTTQPYHSQTENKHPLGPNAQVRTAHGQKIYAYAERNGTYAFWRFFIRIPLADSEMRIQYSIDNGMEMDFVVPGRSQTMRLAAYSCNGFSAGVNPDDLRGPGSQSSYDLVWADLLAKHAEQPFHVLVGGGNQIYCDGIIREPELQEWANQPKPEEKKRYPLTQEILTAIEHFYFDYYCKMFSSGAFAHANSSIARISYFRSCTNAGRKIDGYGSYPDDLQRSPVFNAIGSKGYFFFLLFQCFINVSSDGIDDRPSAHFFKSLIIGGPGTYVPFPSHSFLSPIGPTAWVLMLDCRAERNLAQMCSEEEYRKVFQRLNGLPHKTEHLIIQLGAPIAYPRMVFLESILSSKFNPLGRRGSTAGIRDKFNANPGLLDDLNDHWTSKYHKAERNWFIGQLQLFAQQRRIRITFLSGDVHCAAVGVLKTLQKSKRLSAPVPESDHRYMLNVVTSTFRPRGEPPSGVLTMLSSLSTKRHRTMHYADTDEEMFPLFSKDADGSKPKSQYIMGRRNWCSITLEHPSEELLFDIRVEKKKGHGETIGYRILGVQAFTQLILTLRYPICAPPPRWTPQTT
ncbi:hypothetical protein BJV78DRAFT_1371871 [Lactifluus subvellereus]|nr:hypothetical protein BJV78DRAFT_1371871 [Lactifluus subvellereus]